MVKKLLTIILGLGLAFGASAELTTIDTADVQFWTGTGSNSTVVAIGWDNDGATYTPTVVVWGVRWNGSITLLNALDTIAAYDTRFHYVMGSGGFLQQLYYSDPDEGVVLTPSMEWNCNSYGGVYGSTTLSSTHLRISESTCSDYTFTGVSNIIYASDPNAAFACRKAQVVGVTGVTATTATVNITDTSNVNDYTVKLYAGDSLVDSTVIYTLTISYTELTANTGYTVKVYSNCSDGTQTGARTATFRTPCVTIANDELPWSEDFESYTGLSYASASVSFASQVFCWDLINPYSTSDPYVNNSSSVNVGGGKCLYASSRVSSPTILVLPPFESTPDLLQLSFDVLSTYRHGFEAGVITDVNNDSTFTPVALCLPDGNGWTHFDVTFAGFTTGRLALRNNDNGPAYLDNVTVVEVPSCVKPSQVLVDNITASAADITITDPNGSNHYIVYYTDEDSAEVFADNYSITGLQPNTRYTVRVKTICADTTTGFTETAFRTGCGTIATPYYEDFSQFVDVSNGYGYAVADSTLPCWKFYKARSLDRLELIPATNTYGYGDEGLTLRIYGNYSNSVDMLVLPDLDQEISGLEMSFMARPSETGSMGGTLQVGYVTDADDSSTFVAVANYPCGRFTNGYDLCATTFMDAPNGSNIAIRYLPSGGSAKSWYIDEMDIHDMPACVRAQGISADGITTDGFTLHVADPTQVNHYRCYITLGEELDSVDFYDTVVSVSNLAASSTYELSVVSVCSDGTLTLPYTIEVNTLCAPVETIPFVENFEDWTATQSDGMNRCWDRLYKNSSGNLVSNNYPYCASGSGNALTGFKSLKMYSKGTYSGFSEYSVAYLPELQADLNGLKVSFFYKYGGSTTNINKVKIVVGVSSGVADTTTFTRLATLTPTEIGWNEFEVELSGYTGTGNRITIMQMSTGSTAITSYIDSLVVDTVSSCNRPVALEVSNVSAYGATLTWADPSTADSYIVSWSDGTNVDSVTVTGDTTYTLTDLTPSTNYTVDIRSICWGAATNARSIIFATSCAPMPLPWSMNFDNITNITDLSSCWNRYSGIYVDSTNSAALTSTSSGWTRSTTAFDGSSHVKVNLYGTTCKYWLVTPDIELSEDAELSFDYMLTKYNNANVPDTGAGLNDDRFFVLATTDGGDSWMPVAKWGSDTERDDYPLSEVTNTVSHATLSLEAYTGQVVRIAFYGESTVGGTDNDFRIDNIVVEAAGGTPEPPVDPCATAQALPYNEDFSGYTDDQSMRVYYASAPVADCWNIYGNGRFHQGYDTAATASIYFGGIGYATSTNNFGCMEVGNPYLALIVCQNYDGTYESAINNARNYGNRRYAVLPAFDQPLSHTVLTFNHRTTLHSGAELRVGYIVNDTSDFVALDTIPADYRVTHSDTIRFTQYAGVPDAARLTLLWMSTDTAHTGDYPANYYCGIDNIVVALDTTPVTPEPPADPVDATIAFSDILYWVGEGSDSAVFIVNYAQPDTAFAWGYLFDGSTTADAMVNAIAAADPRFETVGTPSNGGDLHFILENGDTLGLSPIDPAVGYNFWWTNLNGVSAAAGAATTMHNGDVFKYGDLNSAIGWDYQYGYYMQEAWTKAPTPVSVPDTTPDAPEPPAPVEATIAASDILYWIGEGADSAIFVVSDGVNAIAWGYLFDEEDEPTALEMAAEIDAADPRLVYNIVDWATFDMGFVYKEGSLIMNNIPDTRFKVNGVMADDEDMLSDIDVLDGMIVVVSTDTNATWTTPIVPATVKHMPVNSTIDADDILYWIGDGVNEAVVVVNWGVPDTALAWGLRFTDVTTISDAIDAIAAADPRVSTDLAHTTINFTDGDVNLSFQPAPASYMQFLIGNNSNVNSGTALADGDLLKIGESAYGVGYDSTEYYGSWYPMGVVWNTEIHPVSVPDTTSNTPVDPVDATIAFSDILYWVGEGSDSAVFIVNYAQPDTAFAWGYLFNGSTTAENMVNAIAAADPRFETFGTPSNGGDLHFILDNGDTLGLSPIDPELGYNFWWTNLNGLSANAGAATTLHNGDVFKYGDLNSAVAWDFQYGYYMQEAWLKAPTPVSVPDTTTVGIDDVMAVIEGLWPNPTTDYVNVVARRTAEAVLYDLSGRCMATYTLSEGNNKLDLTMFENGVYMLRSEGVVCKVVKR